jgi:hypothetical protein
MANQAPHTKWCLPSRWTSGREVRWADVSSGLIRTRDDHDDDLLLEELMVNERKRLDKQVANTLDSITTK